MSVQQTMTHQFHVSLSNCIMIYGTGQHLTTLAVLVDPSLGQTQTQSGGFLTAASNGSYEEPVALVQTSQVEFTGLQAGLASGHVAQLRVTYNNSPTGVGTITAFGYSQTVSATALQQFANLEKELTELKTNVDAQFHELKQLIARLLGDKQPNGRQTAAKPSVERAR